MKNIILYILICIAPCVIANEIHVTKMTGNPLVKGNIRYEELVEWNRLHPGVMPPLTEEEKYQVFTKKGLPLPGSGITIKPINSIKMTKDQMSTVTSYNKAQKYKGYKEQFSYHAQTLSQMPNAAKEDMLRNPPDYLMSHDTHLRSQATQLKMSYNFHEVDPSLVNQVIGFAPEHTYINNGWTGAVEFFSPKAFNGTCAYHEINIKNTGTSAIIPKEVVSYKVNKKITTVSAEGNSASGFIYEVEWWDKDFRRNLECTTKQYSLDTKNEVITLAQEIDKSRG